MFPHLPFNYTFDNAGQTKWAISSAFPAVGMIYKQDWLDHASARRPYLLQQVIIADHFVASSNSPLAALAMASTSELFRMYGSAYWWLPIRNNVVQFAGINPSAKPRPIITYINTQGSIRQLNSQDHDQLVKSLLRLREMYGYGINIIRFENQSPERQIQLAAETTVSIDSILSIPLISKYLYIPRFY